MNITGTHINYYLICHRKRSKQPPANEVNALVSFGNMICYSQCLRAKHQTPNTKHQTPNTKHQTPNQTRML